MSVFFIQWFWVNPQTDRQCLHPDTKVVYADWYPICSTEHPHFLYSKANIIKKIAQSIPKEYQPTNNVHLHIGVFNWRTLTLQIKCMKKDDLFLKDIDFMSFLLMPLSDSFFQ